MNRLFWKLFLSFWIALILFAAAVILSASFYVDRMRAQQDAAGPYEHFTRHLGSAQSAAQSAGIDGLRRWARDIDRTELIPILLIDADGRDRSRPRSFAARARSPATPSAIARTGRSQVASRRSPGGRSPVLARSRLSERNPRPLSGPPAGDRRTIARSGACRCPGLPAASALPCGADRTPAPRDPGLCRRRL